MPDRKDRYRWHVVYPNGDEAWLCHLRSVRIDMGGRAGPQQGVHLTRLSRGRYYFVETWSTPAGLVAGVAIVTRVSARVSAREMQNARLPFLEAVARAGRQVPADGV